MKLAEALIQRADYQKRIEQLQVRMVQNARVQEGDQPAEDPNALLAEMERVAADLLLLIQRINRTNAATMLEADEMTIADAMARHEKCSTLFSGFYALALPGGICRSDTCRAKPAGGASNSGAASGRLLRLFGERSSVLSVPASRSGGAAAPA